MDYLKELKFPLTMSGLLFEISIPVFLKIDFYAVVLSLAYLVLGSAASVGIRYFEITGQSDAAQAMFGIFVETPAYFCLILGLFYVFTGEFYWIFIGTASFITFIVFAIAVSDWMRAKEKINKNEIDSL